MSWNRPAGGPGVESTSASASPVPENAPSQASNVSAGMALPSSKTNSSESA